MLNQQRSIPCDCDPLSLVLTPNMSIGQNSNGVNAVVEIQDDPEVGKTGRISFAGGVKAFLNFDDNGNLLGYTLTDYNASTENSVANILAFM